MSTTLEYELPEEGGLQPDDPIDEREAVEIHMLAALHECVAWIEEHADEHTRTSERFRARSTAQAARAAIAAYESRNDQ